MVGIDLSKKVILSCLHLVGSDFTTEEKIKSNLLAALATAFLSDGYELNSASEFLSSMGCAIFLFSYPVSWFLVLSPAVAKLPVLP